MKNTLLYTLNVFGSISCTLLAYFLVVNPYLMMKLYKNQYQESMFTCDQAMREHLIAKNRAIYDPSEKALDKLQAAEVGLTDCHEYDKLRKKLLSNGVNEFELSLAGLEAIELRNKDVREFVKTHEFRY